MPRIYLSPSTQDWNPYVDGSGSEEYWMNLLADMLEPYLYANTISFVRNTPEMTAASSIAQANSLGGFDFYLALHSNASGDGQTGKNRGIIVFYYPTSSDGKRAAEALRRAAAHGLPAACKGDDAGDHNARRGAAAQIPRKSHRASAITTITTMRAGSKITSTPRRRPSRGD